MTRTSVLLSTWSDVFYAFHSIGAEFSKKKCKLRIPSTSYQHHVSTFSFRTIDLPGRWSFYLSNGMRESTIASKMCKLYVTLTKCDMPPINSQERSCINSLIPGTVYWWEKVCGYVFWWYFIIFLWFVLYFQTYFNNGTPKERWWNSSYSDCGGIKGCFGQNFFFKFPSILHPFQWNLNKYCWKSVKFSIILHLTRFSCVFEWKSF